MKFAFGWFVLFLVFSFVFGWAEVGLIWMICNSALNMSCFFPLLGVAMTVNLCVSCAWAMVTESSLEKPTKKIRMKRSQR